MGHQTGQWTNEIDELDDDLIELPADSVQDNQIIDSIYGNQINTQKLHDIEEVAKKNHPHAQKHNSNCIEL